MDICKDDEDGSTSRSLFGDLNGDRRCETLERLMSWFSWLSIQVDTAALKRVYPSVDAVPNETGLFLVWTSFLSSMCICRIQMRKFSSNMDEHRTTQTDRGPGTGSPHNCLGPDSSAGSSQQPPILLIGDPIGDKGYALLAVFCCIY
ncbi:unnamed protein product [Haemonchus placei]|uniref:Uncharacterized protein n=1 Tax=Haemonchus placei TaxID=6290 RepID=A0A0N4XA46_HAEPC|nr:unnamed protein product [Haemonchus placei]